MLKFLKPENESGGAIVRSLYDAYTRLEAYDRQIEERFLKLDTALVGLKDTLEDLKSGLSELDQAVQTLEDQMADVLNELNMG